VHTFRAVDGEIVTMRVPESTVFDGIGVMDLRWFTRRDRAIPLAAHGDFKLAEGPAIEVLAKHIPIHGYLTTQKQREEAEGAVIFTLRHGRGQVWVTELAHETGSRDPIAARVLSNLLQCLLSDTRRR
jgi:beta-galactosidase